jgi:hypothetical protein
MNSPTAKAVLYQFHVHIPKEAMLTNRLALSVAGLARRVLQAPRVLALPFGQSFGFSLACLVCQFCPLPYEGLSNHEIARAIMNATAAASPPISTV